MRTWSKLSKRQRKKHHLGEFTETAFEVRFSCPQDLTESQIDDIYVGIIDGLHNLGYCALTLGGTRWDVSGLISSSCRKRPQYVDEHDRDKVIRWFISTFPSLHGLTFGLVDDLWRE